MPQPGTATAPRIVVTRWRGPLVVSLLLHAAALAALASTRVSALLGTSIEAPAAAEVSITRRPSAKNPATSAAKPMAPGSPSVEARLRSAVEPSDATVARLAKPLIAPPAAPATPATLDALREHGEWLARHSSLSEVRRMSHKVRDALALPAASADARRNADRPAAEVDFDSAVLLEVVSVSPDGGRYVVRMMDAAGRTGLVELSIDEDPALAVGLEALRMVSGSPALEAIYHDAVLPLMSALSDPAPTPTPIRD